MSEYEKLHQRISQLVKRNDEFEIENRELREKLYRAENPEFNGKLDTWQAACGKARGEAETLRKESRSLKEEIDLLRSQLETATEFQPIGEACLANRDTLRASLGLTRGDNLHDHVFALRKDAERYRFIRDADRSDGVLDSEDLILYAMESLDDVIDEAMAK